MKILIIEDEEALLDSIRSYLKSLNFICETADTFHAALEKIHLFDYDCIIADIGLPDGNGLNLIKELKSKVSNTGIIIISARSAVDDRITGLDMGADDYLTKPFDLSELNARLKSVLRRRRFQGNKEVVFNEIAVFPDAFKAEIKGKPVVLTKKEFDLLLFLISNKEKVITKESIVEHLWGDYINSVDSYDFIYTHMSNLRKKLIELGANDYVKTVYGIGYKFTAE